MASYRETLTDAQIAELLTHPRGLEQAQRWLIRKVLLSAIQADLLTPDTCLTFRAELAAFISAATDAHEAWEFRSPKSDWERLAGRAGFALVKDGKVTHTLVTVVS